MEPTISKLMSDCSDKDQGKEYIMSFVMSWTLRNAADLEVREQNPRLYNKCQQILFKLLGITNKDYRIKSVKVWKEWKHIDVFSLIVLEHDGKEEVHVLAIEDKVHTKMKQEQRDEYPPIVFAEFDKHKDWKFHFDVVVCYEDVKLIDELRNFCTKGKYAWKVFSNYDLANIEEDKQLTGSEIFDDFWYNRWAQLPEN